MVKQDYLVRMIQEIISAIARAILNKKKIRQQDRDEYDLLTQQMLGFPVKELTTMDVQELIDRYANEEDRIGKIELASVYLLRFSEEVEDDILLKSKLRQDGIRLLKYVQPGRYKLFNTTGLSDPDVGNESVKFGVSFGNIGIMFYFYNLSFGLIV